MSVGPMGMQGAFAGTQLAQTKGTDKDRATQDVADQSRQSQTEKKAEQAAGIGETEQDQGASDRDADDRRPWELGPHVEDSDDSAAEESDGHHEPAKSRDPSGNSGNRLDLSG